MVNEWKQIAYKKLDADADTITLGDTTAKTAEQSFDFTSATGWGQTDTDVDIDDVTNNRLDYTIPNSANQDDAVSFDLGAGNVSDDAWILRFKFTMNSFSQNTTANAKKLMVGISDANHATSIDSNQTAIGMQMMSVDNGTNVYRTRDSEASSWNTGAGTNLARALTAETIWCEIMRISKTSYKVSLFGDSNYTDLLEVQHETMNAITGLRYIKVIINTTGIAPDGTFTGWIDDMTFYNNTNTVVEGGFEPHDMMKLVVYGDVDSNTNVNVILNDDYGGSYGLRKSVDGASDTTTVENIRMDLTASDAEPKFVEALLLDFANQEKLAIAHSVEQQTLGSGTAPDRFETVHKHENQIDRIISMRFRPNTGNFKKGSYAILYGSQRPTITHANGNTLVEVQGDTI